MLNKFKGFSFEVSLSAFAFLFSELVQYNQNRVESVNDLEKRFLTFILVIFVASSSSKRDDSSTD